MTTVGQAGYWGYRKEPAEVSTADTRPSRHSKVRKGRKGPPTRAPTRPAAQRRPKRGYSLPGSGSRKSAPKDPFSSSVPRACPCCRGKRRGVRPKWALQLRFLPTGEPRGSCQPSLDLSSGENGNNSRSCLIGLARGLKQRGRVVGTQMIVTLISRGRASGRRPPPNPTLGQWYL